MIRRLILCLLAMWLPLQGLAAFSMPFCRHDLIRLEGGAKSSPARLVGTAPFDSHARNDRAMPFGERGAHGTLFQCAHCAMCRLACAAVLPTASAGIPIDVAAATPALLTPLTPPSVVLEQPNPPPLRQH